MIKTRLNKFCCVLLKAYVAIKLNAKTVCNRFDVLQLRTNRWQGLFHYLQLHLLFVLLELRHRKVCDSSGSNRKVHVFVIGITMKGNTASMDNTSQIQLAPKWTPERRHT